MIARNFASETLAHTLASRQRTGLREFDLRLRSGRTVHFRASTRSALASALLETGFSARLAQQLATQAWKQTPPTRRAQGGRP